jgi:class 3 adenylate cyclase/tetratricopeptide (TPR) repeat protein
MDYRDDLMTPSDPNLERQQIEQAIAAQESLRGTVDDAIIEASIATLKEKLAALDSRSEQQRKLATILFMDIVDHTALTRGMDPEDQMALIDPLVARLAGKITEFSGHVARYQGDGFKAVFGLPIARENDPEQAIRAGLAVQGEAEKISGELINDHRLAGFKVRVGITTGQVFAGGDTEGEDTIKGPPVNLAARLESAAEPGTVLISYDTYKHVRGIFTLVELEPMQVKGFPDPVQVFKVKGAKPRAFYRGMRLVEGVETRMVGREAELETLKDAYYTVVEDGELQIVTVNGEAGLGKSRLLYEFENWVDLQPADIRLYRGRAHLESQRLPYDLLRSIFAFRFNIQDDDSLEVVQEKWLAGFQEVTGVGDQSEMEAQVTGHLLGYDFGRSRHIQAIGEDAQQLRDRSKNYLTKYFISAASHQPVLILLEDLHWSDTSSLELISQIASAMANSPVMILGAARPSFSERISHWLKGQPAHQQINLKPLSGKQSRILVTEVLQKVEHIPLEFQELIATRSEGNPFYLEELIKMLIEDGTIDRENWHLHSDRLVELKVPTTLTGVLQARLERLPMVEHTLIKQASVVGRVFWDQAISYLNQVGTKELLAEQLQSGVAQLEEKEMIFWRDRSAFAGAEEYIFKHAILREVVYESVLKKIRRKYHLMVADWLIDQSRERVSEFSGLVAQHLLSAGKDKEALSYLIMAGDDAASKFAVQDALDYYTRALDLIPSDQLVTRFELLASRAKLYDLTAQRDEQRNDIGEMIQLADLIDDDALRCDARQLLAEYFLISEPFEVREQALSVIKMAKDIGDQVREARALKLIASLAGRHVLNLAECIDYFNQAAKIFENAGLYLESADCLVWLSGLTEGEWKHASGLSGIEQALIWCQESGDLRREAVCLRGLAEEYLDNNQLQEAQSFAGHALSLNREIGDKTEEARTLLFLGNISIGNQEITEKYLRQSLVAAEEAGSAKTIMYASDALWKYWYHPRGAYQEILEFCDEYLQKMISSGVNWDLGYFHALKSITLTDLG